MMFHPSNQFTKLQVHTKMDKINFSIWCGGISKVLNEFGVLRRIKIE